jgi:hypothetical protein
MVRNEKMALSPKRVMAALSLYTTNFNLTRQQVSFNQNIVEMPFKQEGFQLTCYACMF